MTDYAMHLELSTVDGHVKAMLICDVCEDVRLDSDYYPAAMVSEIILCDHVNTTTVWEYLGKLL